MSKKKTDTQTKLLGGLIAKMVVRHFDRVPEVVKPKHLDNAAREVLARNPRQKGSVVIAKQEAARLLDRARQMHSFTAAMDAYKREMRQIHETEKRNRSIFSRPPVQIGLVAVANLAAVVGILISASPGFLLGVAMWLPTVGVLYLHRALWTPRLAAALQRLREQEE